MLASLTHERDVEGGNHVIQRAVGEVRHRQVVVILLKADAPLRVEPHVPLHTVLAVGVWTQLSLGTGRERSQAKSNNVGCCLKCPSGLLLLSAALGTRGAGWRTGARWESWAA